MKTNNKHKNENGNEQTRNKKAHKGKTLLILTREEYKHKINNFLQDNHSRRLTSTQPNAIKNYKTSTKTMQ
jgi:hypothetical protein